MTSCALKIHLTVNGILNCLIHTALDIVSFVLKSYLNLLLLLNICVYVLFPLRHCVLWNNGSLFILNCKS